MNLLTNPHHTLSECRALIDASPSACLLLADALLPQGFFLLGPPIETAGTDTPGGWVCFVVKLAVTTSTHFPWFSRKVVGYTLYQDESSEGLATAIQEVAQQWPTLPATLVYLDPTITTPASYSIVLARVDPTVVV
jgi:hypothetical protein